MKNKITYGFVVQSFNDEGQCMRQDFVAGDEVNWEDDVGNPIDEEDFYESYDMVQPTRQFAVGDKVQCVYYSNNGYFQFEGEVVGYFSNQIAVRDSRFDVYHCDTINVTKIG